MGKSPVASMLAQTRKAANRFAAESHGLTVMRGLDPRIHLLRKMMDGRIKSGHDGVM